MGDRHDSQGSYKSPKASTFERCACILKKIGQSFNFLLEKKNHTGVFHSIMNAHAASSSPGGSAASRRGVPKPETDVSQTNPTTDEARISPG
jgi:hypothetical protein